MMIAFGYQGRYKIRTQSNLINMRQSKTLLLVTARTLLIVLLSISTFQCSKDDEKPSRGKITGKVTDLSSGATLADVHVIVFNSSSNAPENTVTTNASGDYTVEVSPGTYFLKFYKQGYIALPSPGMEAISFSVAAAETIDQPAEMSASAVTDTGWITGKVSAGSAAMAGVLVVAEGNGEAYSGLSDHEGNYTIFNVPAGSYDVKGYTSAYSTTVAPALVSSGSETTDINLNLTQNATGNIDGTFKVISQTTIAEAPAKMTISWCICLPGKQFPVFHNRCPILHRSTFRSLTFPTAPTSSEQLMKTTTS
jgi:hypothetical protein